jgi:hypothetical protein
MTGYGALAGCHRDIEAFRRFSVLNAENLLHMQAELQHIELIINEVRGIPGCNSFDHVWVDDVTSDSNSDIQKVFERSRALLNEYCKPHRRGAS